MTRMDGLTGWATRYASLITEWTNSIWDATLFLPSAATDHEGLDPLARISNVTGMDVTPLHCGISTLFCHHSRNNVWMSMHAALSTSVHAGHAGSSTKARHLGTSGSQCTLRIILTVAWALWERQRTRS